MRAPRNSCFAILNVFGCLATSTFAQRSPRPTAPAWSPSKDIGVFVFGKNNQTPDQQLKDESDCYAAAKQQTGIDPKAPPPPQKSAEQKAAEQETATESASTPKGGRVKGAAAGPPLAPRLARLPVMPARERLPVPRPGR